MRSRTVAATVAGLCAASGVAQHPVQLHEDAMRGVPKKEYSSSGCSSGESVGRRGGAIQPCRLVGARVGEVRTSSLVIRLMVCRTEGMFVRVRVVDG